MTKYFPIFFWLVQQSASPLASFLCCLALALSIFAFCNADSHVNTTKFFLHGNLPEHSAAELFSKWENNPLHSCFRSMGTTAIAFFAGMWARDVVAYRKYDPCKKLFNSSQTLKIFQDAGMELKKWSR